MIRSDNWKQVFQNSVMFVCCAVCFCAFILAAARGCELVETNRTTRMKQMFPDGILANQNTRFYEDATRRAEQLVN